MKWSAFILSLVVATVNGTPPTSFPTVSVTNKPTASPTTTPSQNPTFANAPTLNPTATLPPTASPTIAPTGVPTVSPTTCTTLDWTDGIQNWAREFDSSDSFLVEPNGRILKLDCDNALVDCSPYTMPASFANQVYQNFKSRTDFRMGVRFDPSTFEDRSQGGPNTYIFSIKNTASNELISFGFSRNDAGISASGTFAINTATSSAVPTTGGNGVLNLADNGDGRYLNMGTSTANEYVYGSTTIANGYLTFDFIFAFQDSDTVWVDVELNGVILTSSSVTIGGTSSTMNTRSGGEPWQLEVTGIDSIDFTASDVLSYNHHFMGLRDANNDMHTNSDYSFVQAWVCDSSTTSAPPPPQIGLSTCEVETSLSLPGDSLSYDVATQVESGGLVWALECAVLDSCTQYQTNNGLARKILQFYRTQQDFTVTLRLDLWGTIHYGSTATQVAGTLLAIRDRYDEVKLNFGFIATEAGVFSVTLGYDLVVNTIYNTDADEFYGVNSGHGFIVDYVFDDVAVPGNSAFRASRGYTQVEYAFTFSGTTATVTVSVNDDETSPSTGTAQSSVTKNSNTEYQYDSDTGLASYPVPIADYSTHHGTLDRDVTDLFGVILGPGTEGLSACDAAYTQDVPDATPYPTVSPTVSPTLSPTFSCDLVGQSTLPNPFASYHPYTTGVQGALSNYYISCATYPDVCDATDVPSDITNRIYDALVNKGSIDVVFRYDLRNTATDGSSGTGQGIIFFDIEDDQSSGYVPLAFGARFGDPDQSSGIVAVTAIYGAVSPYTNLFTGADRCYANTGNFWNTYVFSEPSNTRGYTEIEYKLSHSDANTLVIGLYVNGVKQSLSFCGSSHTSSDGNMIVDVSGVTYGTPVGGTAFGLRDRIGNTVEHIAMGIHNRQLGVCETDTLSGFSAEPTPSPTQAPTYEECYVANIEDYTTGIEADYTNTDSRIFFANSVFQYDCGASTVETTPEFNACQAVNRFPSSVLERFLHSIRNHVDTYLEFRIDYRPFEVERNTQTNVRTTLFTLHDELLLTANGDPGNVIFGADIFFQTTQFFIETYTNIATNGLIAGNHANLCRYTFAASVADTEFFGGNADTQGYTSIRFDFVHTSGDAFDVTLSINGGAVSATSVSTGGAFCTSTGDNNVLNMDLYLGETYQPVLPYASILGTHVRSLSTDTRIYGLPLQAEFIQIIACEQSSVLAVSAPPTLSPTNAPSTSPTASPTTSPTISPTVSPTTSPTISPTTSPTTSPTLSPTVSPTLAPTLSPTVTPTISPTDFACTEENHNDVDPISEYLTFGNGVSTFTTSVLNERMICSEVDCTTHAFGDALATDIYTYYTTRIGFKVIIRLDFVKYSDPSYGQNFGLWQIRDGTNHVILGASMRHQVDGGGTLIGIFRDTTAMAGDSGGAAVNLHFSRPPASSWSFQTQNVQTALESGTFVQTNGYSEVEITISFSGDTIFADASINRGELVPSSVILGDAAFTNPSGTTISWDASGETYGSLLSGWNFVLGDRRSDGTTMYEVAPGLRFYGLIVCDDAYVKLSH